MPTFTYHAIILGAGASGLMCAATAAQHGKKVLLIDHARAAGRKLLITGGGKGNITNRHVTTEHFFGENPLFCRSALAQFSPQAMLQMLEDAAIAVEEREEGQFFCKYSAEDVLHFLLTACHACDFALEETVTAVEHPAMKQPLTPFTLGTQRGEDSVQLQHQKKSDDAHPCFIVQTNAKTYHAHNLVIATGGPAWPQVGATDFGIALARRFGHRIVQPRPALVGLTMSIDWPLAGLAGISHRVDITLTDTKTQALPLSLKNSLPPNGLVAQSLPLLFTHRGISGPAALQASLYWQQGFALSINFLPKTCVSSVLDAKESGKTLAGNLIKQLLPTRLAESLVPEDVARKKTAELSRVQRNALFTAIHTHSVTPTGTEGIKKAEVTSGGVSTEGISSTTLQSKMVPGLFFCGEVLDVTGRLGGYNLHWAFASGRLAGAKI